MQAAVVCGVATDTGLFACIKLVWLRDGCVNSIITPNCRLSFAGMKKSLYNERKTATGDPRLADAGRFANGPGGVPTLPDNGVAHGGPSPAHERV